MCCRRRPSWTTELSSSPHSSSVRADPAVISTSVSLYTVIIHVYFLLQCYLVCKVRIQILFSFRVVCVRVYMKSCLMHVLEKSQFRFQRWTRLSTLLWPRCNESARTGLRVAMTGCANNYMMRVKVTCRV